MGIPPANIGSEDIVLSDDWFMNTYLPSLLLPEEGDRHVWCDSDQCFANRFADCMSACATPAGHVSEASAFLDPIVSMDQVHPLSNPLSLDERDLLDLPDIDLDPDFLQDLMPSHADPAGPGPMHGLQQGYGRPQNSLSVFIYVNMGP